MHSGGSQHIYRLDGDELVQLYLHPAWTGPAVMRSRLVDLAKRSRPDGLSLGRFQSNRGAQRF